MRDLFPRCRTILLAGAMTSTLGCRDRSGASEAGSAPVPENPRASPDPASGAVPGSGWIYQLTRSTRNATACDTEGASDLEEIQESFLAIGEGAMPTVLGTPGQRLLTVVSCTGVDDCATKAAGLAAGRGAMGDLLYSFQRPDGAGRWSGTQVSGGHAGPDAVCKEAMVEDLSIGPIGAEEIRFERRVRRSPDYPSNAGCSTAVAERGARGRQCDELRVMVGRRVNTK